MLDPREVIIVNVPNIATITATVWPLHFENRAATEEVVSTMFTVSLNGQVQEDVSKRSYRINLIMKIEVKHYDNDEDLRPPREKVLNDSDEAIFSHRAQLISSQETADIQRLRLKYTMCLTKNL